MSYLPADTSFLSTPAPYLSTPSPYFASCPPAVACPCPTPATYVSSATVVAAAPAPYIPAVPLFPLFKFQAQGILTSVAEKEDLFPTTSYLPAPYVAEVPLAPSVLSAPIPGNEVPPTSGLYDKNGRPLDLKGKPIKKRPAFDPYSGGVDGLYDRNGRPLNTSQKGAGYPFPFSFASVSSVFFTS